MASRTWTWTLSSEQLRAFWKLKELHLTSHHAQVRIKITGKPEAPAIVHVEVEDPPAGGVLPTGMAREGVANLLTRRAERPR